MTSPLAVGDVIHGFAHGVFGRDHYDCVRIEAVGPDWIVARDPDSEWNGPSFTTGQRSLELCQQSRDEPCSHARHRQEMIGEPDARCPLDGRRSPLTDDQRPLTDYHPT